MRAKGISENERVFFSGMQHIIRCNLFLNRDLQRRNGVLCLVKIAQARKVSLDYR